VPQTYYGLRASAKGITRMWKDRSSGSTRTFDRGRIQGLERDLEGREAVVEEVRTSRKKTYAPLLYDLTELQKDAYKKFGFSAKETLNIMQRLYENHKVLTYPRTDSRYIGTDVVPTIKERLKACNQGPYKAYIPALLRSEIRPNRSFVDDKKVSDHHAIIPTEEAAIFSNMTNEERKIYDLVVRRFLSVLYPPFEYEQTSLKADLGSELFAAEGQTVLSKGWKTVYEDADATEKESKALPALKKGSVLAPDQITLTSGKTTPPPRFTEAT